MSALGAVRLRAQERSQSGLELHAERAMVDQPARAPHAMVASVNELASLAGVEVLRNGGNAVDAAVAVATTLAVVHPEAGNLGGGGHMLVRMADGRTASIDYGGVAPAAAQADTPVRELVVGYKAAAVPGTPAGLGLAHENFGRASWRSCLERARRLAKDGFPASQRMELILQLQVPVMKEFPETARIFLHGGETPLKQGERVVQPELAETLRRLQQHGWREFYTGRTGELIARDMAAHGGWVDAGELAAYRAFLREPLRSSYRGHPFLTVAPSAVGGLELAMALNILGRQVLPLGGEGSSAVRQLQIEAMRRAYGALPRLVAAGADPDALVRTALSPAFSERLSAGLTVGAPAGGRPATMPDLESPETTHFSVVDAEGNIVSNTYTLSGFYGSQVIVKGAGVLLNNLNRHPQGGAYLAEGRRYRSTMAGTILLTPEGRPWAALGSPGGDTIPSTVMQVANNLIDFKMSLRDAVEQPRLHYEASTGMVEAEPGALVPDVAGRLRALGYRLNPKLRSQGDCNAVMIDPATSWRVGAADGRRGGVAQGF